MIFVSRQFYINSFYFILRIHFFGSQVRIGQISILRSMNGAEICKYVNTLYKLDAYHQHTFLHTFLIQKISKQLGKSLICGKNNKGPSIFLLRIQKVEAQLLQKKPLKLHFIFLWDFVSIRNSKIRNLDNKIQWLILSNAFI